MPLRRQPLKFAATVILDGSGNGTASLGPNVGQRWIVRTASVNIPNAVAIPQCNIYMGAAPIPAEFIDGTWTGNMDSTSKTNSYPLTHGEKIWAVWTAGDVGATATLNITGWHDTGYAR